MHPFALRSASEVRRHFGTRHDMELSAQLSALVHLFVMVANVFRNLPLVSHGSTTFALASPLAQLAWFQFWGRRVPLSQKSALLFSLVMGFWGMAMTIPPVVGFGLVVLRVLVGARAWLRLLSPLKLLGDLPTSHAPFGEHLL